jgi:Flp pilus assembly protein TadG
MKRQRGTQILELALVLPVLALIVFIVLEGGELSRAHTVLNNAAREGARFLAQPEQHQCILDDGCTFDTLYSDTCLNKSNDIFSSVRTATCAYIQWENSTRPANAQVAVKEVTVTITQKLIPNGSSPGVMMPVTVVSVSYPYPFLFLKKFTNTPITLNAQAQFRQF